MTNTATFDRFTDDGVVVLTCDCGGTADDAQPVSSAYGGWVVTWGGYCDTCGEWVETTEDHT